jgi:hypothetical protein
MIQERLNTYDKDQCWQYDIRVKNLEEDLIECGFTKGGKANRSSACGMKA